MESRADITGATTTEAQRGTVSRSQEWINFEFVRAIRNRLSVTYDVSERPNTTEGTDWTHYKKPVDR
jgi:hypothetical protein